MLYVTEEASRWIFKQLDENKAFALRVEMKASGCSGFKYAFSLVEEAAGDDVVICEGGARMVVDPVSITMLYGATIDLESTPFKKQLIIVNPNSLSTCGCGESVSFETG
jgi:iron-sulfur cluster assembly protein